MLVYCKDFNQKKGTNYQFLKFTTNLSSVKGSSNFSSSKRKSHVPRVSSGNRVHSKSTSLVSSLCKGCLGVYVNSSRLESHL